MSLKVSVVDPPTPGESPCTTPLLVEGFPLTTTEPPVGSVLRSRTFPVPDPRKVTPPVGGATNVVEPEADPLNSWMPLKQSVAPPVKPVTVPDVPHAVPFAESRLTVVPEGSALRSRTFPVPDPRKVTPPVGGATNVVEPEADPLNTWMPLKVSELPPAG